MNESRETYKKTQTLLPDLYRTTRGMMRVMIPLSIRRKVVQIKRRYWPSLIEPTELVELEEIPIELPETKFDVVCFPIIDWNFRFQRPQQLMSQFARAGHRVFYVQQNFRATGPDYSITSKAPNIFEISLRGPLLNVYSDKLSEKGSFALLNSLNALRRDYGICAALSCVQLPFWGPLVERTREMFSWPILYDCMDYHAGFATDHYELLEAEATLLSQADQVVVSSKALEEYAAPYNSRIELIRNGCDYEHFSKVPQSEIIRDLASRPVIGYYGAIAEWFNVELVAELASHKTEWDFVLIGAVTVDRIDQLRRLPNVTFTGEIPYTELPKWLATFDATIIPFKQTALTQATNPVKAYETLAAGKPIIAKSLPEILVLGEVVRTADTVAEYEEQISLALAENSLELMKSRQDFAAQHTWTKRFEQLLPLTTKIFPKASIVIVTSNNLALTQMSLRYLYDQTEWPDFETIVIDNASTDGTIEFLREAEALYPHFKVILNDENAGFAKAANSGLQMASGEYLVLLNPDIVVRGWLSNLIRHLAADKKIGLLGSASNESGKEARMNLSYQNLEEIPARAFQYVRQHDDELVEVSTLPLSCLAMRREAYEKIGALDENPGMEMLEADDYARRARELGFTVMSAQDVFIAKAGFHSSA